MEVNLALTSISLASKAKEWFIQCTRSGLEMKCKFRQRGGGRTAAGVRATTTYLAGRGNADRAGREAADGGRIQDNHACDRPLARPEQPRMWRLGAAHSHNTPAVVTFELTKLGATDVADGAPRDAMP